MNDHDRRIQAVAFDLDGLMFNTEDLYVEVAEMMLARRGFRLDIELIHQMMGLPARVGLPLMIQWYDLPDSVAELDAETGRLFDQILPTRLQPMPGLEALLRYLDQGQIPKAIVTSSRRSYLDRILRLAALPYRFAFSLTADDVTRGKPEPDVYLMAARRFGIAPDRMLVLEDSRHGCQAGVAAGAVTVAVPGAHNPPHDYAGVVARVDGLQDPRVMELLESRSRE